MASTLPLWPWSACSALFQMSSWLASVTFFLCPSVSASAGGRRWLLKDSCSPSPGHCTPAPLPHSAFCSSPSTFHPWVSRACHVNGNHWDKPSRPCNVSWFLGDAASSAWQTQSLHVGWMDGWLMDRWMACGWMMMDGWEREA